MSTEEIIGLTGVLVVAASALLLWYQIWSTHNWNRRKSTHDLLASVSSGSPAELRHRLELRIKVYDPREDYARLQPPLEEEEWRVLMRVLNYFELICQGIRHGIIDDDMAFAYVSNPLIAYYRWSQPFIVRSREVAGPNTFIELERRAKLWHERRGGDKPARANDAPKSKPGPN